MPAIDYVGHLTVTPALDDDEISLLRALRSSRHRPPYGPEGRSPWRPCPEGCCLTAAGKACAGSAAQWLRHLVRGPLCRHDVRGTVVGCRRDDRLLFAVAASAAGVRSRVLWTPVVEPAYVAARAGSARSGAPRANVIPFGRRPDC